MALVVSLVGFGTGVVTANQWRTNIQLEKVKIDIKKEIQSEIQGIKHEVEGIKSEVQGLKNEIEGIKLDVRGIKETLNKIASQQERNGSWRW